MITIPMRFSLTINEIETDDSYEENFDLFNKGIDLLKERLKNENYTEFTDEERETLEEIYTIINQ